jgi:hypothetical protein
MFGLATGRIRHESGEVITAANGLLAFMELPNAISDGYLGRPSDDYTERGDYRLLFQHETDKHPLEYVQGLATDEIEKIADCSESLFLSLVHDASVIPMDPSAKMDVIKAMAFTH